MRWPSRPLQVGDHVGVPGSLRRIFEAQENAYWSGGLWVVILAGAVHVEFRESGSPAAPTTRQCDPNSLKDGGLPAIVGPDEKRRFVEIEFQLTDAAEILNTQLLDLH
jgi:hypothetical protein